MAFEKPKNSHHFAAGSDCPPIVPGLLRLYSMYYCPYAQRTRIVLNAKNVKHDVVNIHLKKKPEWFLKINPLAKVPTMQLDDRIMYESMITCDYLDEVYPDPPLYPKDPWAKAADKCLIEVFSSSVIRCYYKFFGMAFDDVAGITKALGDLKDELVLLECELTNRGSKFLFGDKPGMVDYAIFPWIERIFIIQKMLPEFTILCPVKFPKLSVYASSIMEDPAAMSTVANLDHHVAYYQSVLQGSTNYDIGV